MNVYMKNSLGRQLNDDRQKPNLSLNALMTVSSLGVILQTENKEISTCTCMYVCMYVLYLQTLAPSAYVYSQFKKGCPLQTLNSIP